MKKISLFLLLFVCLQYSFAQKTNGPVMTFEVTTLDYGKIAKGSDPIRKFKFTNMGNEPLIITNAQASCGCVVVTWPKEPIMPGNTQFIQVRYDTKRVGVFTKTITVTTNEVNDIRALTITGDVLQETPLLPK